MDLTVIRIDDQIVEKLNGGGIRITPICLFDEVPVLPFVSLGSRNSDSLLMQRLLNGTMLFDDLNILFPL
jgi:hypothetical protein